MVSRSVSSWLYANTAIVLCANVLNKAVSILLAVYAARALGPADYGVYGLVNAAVAVASFFTIVGTTPMAIRELARGGRDLQLINELVGFRLVLATASYLAMMTTVWMLRYDPEVLTLLAIAGTSLVTGAITGSFYVMYIATERMAVPSVMSVCVQCANTAAGIFALYWGKGLRGLFVVSAVFCSVEALVGLVWVSRKIVAIRPRFAWRQHWELVRMSLPFAVAGLATVLNQNVSLLLLSVLPGPLPKGLAMGYFTAASRIPSALELIPHSIRVAVIPRLAANVEDRSMVREILHVSVKLLVGCIALPIVFLVAILPRDLMTLLFGAQYAAGAAVLVLLGVSCGVNIATAPWQYALSATRDIGRFTPWMLATLAVNVAVGAVLVPRYGPVGAAWAVLVSGLFLAAVRLALFRATFSIGVMSAGPVVRVGALFLGTAAAVWTATRAIGHPWPRLALAVSAYGAFVLVSGLINLSAIQRWLTRRAWA